jgi:hypothetical protein
MIFHTGFPFSAIQKYGYDEEKKRYYVFFHDGSAYEYLNVPRKTYEGMLREERKDWYLNTYLKGEYCVRKIQ